MNAFRIYSIVVLLALAVSYGKDSYSAEQPPPPRSKTEITAVLAKAPRLPHNDSLEVMHILLVADKKDHGKNEHDYPLWQRRWSVLLGATTAAKSSKREVRMFDRPECQADETATGSLNVRVTTAWQWPARSDFRSADVIVVFCYIKWDIEKQQQLREYLNNGGGLVLIHSAVWTMPQASPAVADIVGVGGYQYYRHGQLELQIVAGEHPICLGMPERVIFRDESYWPPTPETANMQIHTLAVSSEETVPEAIDSSDQPMFWTYEFGKGRVFGCVPGHYTWTFDDPYFRILLLRGIAWSAGGSPYRFDHLVMQGASVQ